MAFSILLFAVSGVILFSAAIVLRRLFPHYARWRRVRLIFRDYCRLKSGGAAEEEAWGGAARNHFLRLKWDSARIESGVEMMRLSCRDFGERRDIVAGEKEKAKELARRLLVSASAGDSRLSVHETEKIYWVVETAARSFFRKK